MIIIKPDKMGKKNKQGMPFQRLLKPCRQAYGGLLRLTSAGSSRNKNILGGEREVGAASSGIIITTNNIRVIGKSLRFYAANTNNSNPEMADKDDKKKNADEESSAAAIGGGGGGGGGVKLNPQNYKVQSLVHADPSGGWEKCWEQGLAPWDLGKPTPVILHLHQTSALPKGRALVPGCGSGHDVTAIACPDRYVVGLDISNEAIKQAIEMSSSLPNANYFTFLTEDFFGWRPTELFDLIFDYTFFCAIEPEMRPAWARQVRDLLKYDGELITLIFPISDHVGGPPYKVSVSDYEEVLLPVGFEAVSIVDNELAVGARKGREKLGRWKKILNQSSL